MLAIITLVLVGIGQVIPHLSASQGPVADALHRSSGTPQANTPIPVPNPDKARDGTIVIVGESGSIIGRLTKIPAQNEHITEIKPVSEVDNKAGRELLSIINQY